jgi:hypothetical protein
MLFIGLAAWCLQKVSNLKMHGDIYKSLDTIAVMKGRQSFDASECNQTPSTSLKTKGQALKQIMIFHDHKESSRIMHAMDQNPPAAAASASSSF